MKKRLDVTLSLIENLDDMPFPARDLLKNEVYRHAFLDPYAAVYSARGCPNNCKFCTSKGYSPVYRARSVDNVLIELEEICINIGIKSFGFMDDTFTVIFEPSISAISPI